MDSTNSLGLERNTEQFWAIITHAACERITENVCAVSFRLFLCSQTHTHFHDVTQGTHIFGYALARRLYYYRATYLLIPSIFHLEQIAESRLRLDHCEQYNMPIETMTKLF